MKEGKLDNLEEKPTTTSTYDNGTEQNLGHIGGRQWL